MISFVLYESRARTHDEVDADVLNVLRAAERNNKRLGVTGFLYKIGGAYYQYIEGPEDVIGPLYATIGKDYRHHTLRVVEEGQTEARQFPGFEMGFASGPSKLLDALVDVPEKDRPKALLSLMLTAGRDQAKSQ